MRGSRHPPQLRHFSGPRYQPLRGGHSSKGDEMYTCTMHPDIQQPAPGRCPRCGMGLVPANGAWSAGAGLRHMIGMCLNWKVLGALGAVAVAVFLLRPQLGPSLLPLVFVLACPLSMVLMMGGMGGMGRGQAPPLVASPTAEGDPSPDPVEVLRQRYARGEIDHEELSGRLGDLLDPKLGG